MPPSFTIRWIVSPRPVFTFSSIVRLTADFQSTPAASVVPRCAASTPSKIDFQGLLADLAFEFGDAAFAPASFAVAGKHLAGALAELLAPSVQDVGVHPPVRVKPRQMKSLAPAASQRPV
jgi:hypothetical protein